MDVVIGIDPHKASHTAVALGDGEVELDRVEVRSGPKQLARLMAWAEPFPQRRWAIEGAEGLGFLLAQQLVAADQDVVDVPATLAARTRLLGSGRSGKNDCNDALSVAVTALRHRQLRAVVPPGSCELLRLLAKRHIDLSNQRTPARVAAARTGERALTRRNRQGTELDRRSQVPGDDDPDGPGRPATHRAARRAG